jgi:hypothetical protein
MLAPSLFEKKNHNLYTLNLIWLIPVTLVSYKYLLLNNNIEYIMSHSFYN